MFCLSAGGKKERETKAPDQLTCDQALIFFCHFSGGGGGGGPDRRLRTKSPVKSLLQTFF